jgi:hypothetical protein
MKNLILLSLAGFASLMLVTSNASANADVRDWKLKSGETKRAELLRVDEAKKIIYLREATETGLEGKEFTLKIDLLAPLDRAWVLEWSETADELAEKLKQLGGTMDHHQEGGATTQTDFYVYHPKLTSGVNPDQRPLMILFDAGGKGQRYLLRHVEAAQAVGMVMVACDVFRNGVDDGPLFTRFKELLPVILQTVKHDPKRIFLGGTSGAAERAYHYSAQFPEIPWAGVYANGGWLGPPMYYNLPYPAMRVAMVNGDKDTHANDSLEPTSIVLQQRGVTISVMAFEGAHQIPPVSVQIKALRWLLKELE